MALLTMTSLTTTSKICDAVREGLGLSQALPSGPQRDLNIAVLSDIHLGHHRTNTYHIVKALRHALPDNEETANLDLILLAGDVFDRLLTLPQEEVEEIQQWIADLLSLCRRHNILLRVLEGTPSHDWKQSQQFENINNGLEYPANLKFVGTLSIETIEELGGLTVLYVPDEWNHDASVTWVQVNELLKQHGLEKVDVACMHGQFEYQLPIESIKSHNSEWYKSIVRHYIVIGHVHIRTENGIILAQGSLDRLSHGEEAPKGHYRMCISPNGNWHWFVENTLAKLYLTVDVRGWKLEQLHKYLAEHEHLPDDTSFRFMFERDSELARSLKDIKKLYPQFKFSTQMEDLKKAEDIHIQRKDDKIVQPISMTANNIDHLVQERAEKILYINGMVDPVKLDHLMKTLNKYKFKGVA